MTRTLTEKRTFPRAIIILPVRVTPNFIGETFNLCEIGVNFMFRERLLSSAGRVRIELSGEESMEAEFKIVWNKYLAKENKFIYGARFRRLKEKDLKILRGILANYEYLDETFVKLANEFRNYLKSIKTKFDEFDTKNLDEKDRINSIKAEEKEIFGKLDMYFNNTWEIARNFTEEEYDFHQKYSRRMLWPLLRDPVETNRLVCEKPLGYAGDFIIMNYIYDFHNKYLGSSSYEKLINFYTCNIPISTSVVKRKDFFKKKILEVLGSRRFPNVLSVGSGPTRELLELVREAKIVKPLYFDCLDFEKKALEYIQTELQKIESEKKSYVHIGFINKNILDLIKDRKIENTLRKYDLIYASGLFDYLFTRTAKKVINNLYRLLNRKGVLIVTNAEKENATHQAYYEILGEWYLHHRTKRELLAWTKDIQNANIKFDETGKENSFLFLCLNHICPHGRPRS